MDRRIDAPVAERGASLATERLFFASCTLLFIASAGLTILWSVSAGGMPSPWMSMPGQGWLSAAATFVVMWTVMMLAMMLPSLTPRLLSFRHDLRLTGMPRLDVLTVLALAGYFGMWALFGAVVYPPGAALKAASIQSMRLERLAPVLIGIVLLLAGGYQLTEWKQRQLMRCWDAAEAGRVGARSAWRYGLRLGWHCILCCAGFMLVLLVSGVMNLAVMALVAAAITVERVVSRPLRFSRLVGVLIILAGLVVIAQSLGIVH